MAFQMCNLRSMHKPSMVCNETLKQDILELYYTNNKLDYNKAQRLD